MHAPPAAASPRAEPAAVEDAGSAADPAEVMAAVDLGSNSFHMVVARLRHGQLIIIDRLREMIRLASGLDTLGYLDEASQERALAALRRFGQRLRDMDAHQVRVVGTSALRRARNADAFLGAAEAALGHPVEVVSGMEEARLIYLGVSHHVDERPGSNLVIDIGGGSTELIIGEGYQPKYLESLAIGCVGLSQQYFAEGALGRRRFDRARLAVRLELRPIAAVFQRLGWTRAVGSSGTVRAAGEAAHQLGLVDSGITAAALEALIAEMIKARSVEKLKIPALGAERAPVFPGGAAILVEILQTFGIERLQISDGALREGLLYDMLGRLRREDARERTIRAVQRRYHVDEEQAGRVEVTALQLHAKAALAWRLEDERCERLLRWAACLHEVGLDIAHHKYHQHGGYLLAHADLPGFSRLEQQLLATLVRFHRRKLDELSLDDVIGSWRAPVFKLIVLFRLAVLLNRSRSLVELPEIELLPARDALELRFPARWLADNPLTEADLSQERQWLEARGFDLRLREA